MRCNKCSIPINYWNSGSYCPNCGKLLNKNFNDWGEWPIGVPPKKEVTSITTPAQSITITYNDSEFVRNAKELSNHKKYDKHDAFSHLVEEVGEVATCLNNEITKRKVLKEPLRSECVDVINCALELFFMDGGTIEELNKISKEKQSKWKSNLEKM